MEIFFHDAQRFDSHLILFEALKSSDKNVTILPHSLESLISFYLLIYLFTYLSMENVKLKIRLNFYKQV